MCRIQFRINQERQRQEEQRKADEEESSSQVDADEGNDDDSSDKAPEEEEKVALLSPVSKKYINAQTIGNRQGFYNGYLNLATFTDFGTQLATFIHTRQLALDPATTDILQPLDIKDRSSSI
jgi:hypothetical protein